MIGPHHSDGDEVLPEVPLRQWVCSLPWRLRYAMGYDRKLCSDVLAAFVGALRRSLRWRAKRELGLRSLEDAQVGGVTVIQRADSSLRMNVVREVLGGRAVATHRRLVGTQLFALRRQR